jgi:hypothetical protein
MGRLGVLISNPSASLRIKFVKNLIVSTESMIEILPCLPAGRGYGLRMTPRDSLLAKGRWVISLH